MSSEAESAPGRRPKRPGAALAAIGEVLGIYVSGQLVTFALARVLGVPLRNPLGALTAGTSSSALLDATRDLGILLLLQYAGWFLLIVPIGWWHRRRTRAEYGLTRAAIPLGRLIIIGLVTFAAGEFLARILEVVNAFVPLGTTAPWRQAVFDMSWTRWEFWLFTAIGSFGLVAVGEELFYRGYCQRRLAEDLGDGPAIVGVAALFTFSHGQYLIANAYSIGMVISLLAGSLAVGYVYARTRSLIPTIVAHAIVNVPSTRPFQLATLAVMAIIAWRARQPIAAAIHEGIGWLQAVTPRWLPWAMAVGGAAFAVLNQHLGDMMLPIGLLLLVGAVGLEWRDKRRGRIGA